MRSTTATPRLTIGVAAATWFASLMVSNVIGAAIVAATGRVGTPTAELPPWMLATSVTSLWIPTILGLRWVSDRYGNGNVRRDFGLEFRGIDSIGLVIGVLCQLVLLELIYWPLRRLFPGTFARDAIEEPARNMFDRTHGAWLVMLIVIVVVGAPLVEELLYRGLILRSIESRVAAPIAIGASAVWFGLAHLQLVQLPGLVAFGVVLAVCAVRTRRLGMSVLAHAAFNATTVAMLLARR